MQKRLERREEEERIRQQRSQARVLREKWEREKKADEQEQKKKINPIWIWVAFIVVAALVIVFAFIGVQQARPKGQAIANEVSREDAQEGSDPDYRKLTIKYDDEMIYITLALHSGFEKLSNERLYLYGPNHDLIRLSTGMFEVVRDAGFDGTFEQSICIGSTRRSGSSTLVVDVPLSCIPDIGGKEIWLQSPTSKDRLPDGEEKLRMGAP